MARQSQIFENNTAADLYVDIEPNPDQWVLKPGDVMRVSYDDDGKGLRTGVERGGLTLYLTHFDTVAVTINDVAVPAWAE